MHDERGGGRGIGPAPIGRPSAPKRALTGTQKWVLVITAAAFGLMIFSVIPWSAVLGGAPHRPTTTAATRWLAASRSGSS